MSHYSRECKQTAADLACMLIGADRALENRTIERERPCYSEMFWKEERKSPQRNVTMVSAAVVKHSCLLWNGKGHGLVARRVSAYKYSRRFHISALLGKLESVRQFIKEEVAQCNTSEVDLGCCNGQPRRGRSGGYFIMFRSLVHPGQLHRQQSAQKLRGSPNSGSKMAAPCK